MTPIINIIHSIINKKNVIQQKNTVETNNWNNIFLINDWMYNVDNGCHFCSYLLLKIYHSGEMKKKIAENESDYIMCFIGQKEGYFRNIRLTINNQPLIFLYYNTLFHRVSNQLKRSKSLLWYVNKHVPSKQIKMNDNYVIRCLLWNLSCSKYFRYAF
jgi:hypothetical protein